MLQAPLLPQSTSSPIKVTAVVVSVFVLFMLLLGLGQGGKNKTSQEPQEPPRLPETIPFISNTWQFMTNKTLFISRARQALKTSPVVQCRLGPLKVHLVTGGTNVSAIFRSSFSSEPWIMRIMAYGAGYAAQDMAKIAKDDSGGTKQPRPGSRTDTRIWHAMHSMYDRTMLSPAPVDDFAQRFQRLFAERLTLASPAVGVWDEDIQIHAFLRQNMTHAATHAVHGPLLLEINPGFVDAFWEYEKHVERLAFGLPTWMNWPAVRARDKLSAICRSWFEIGDARFDWVSHKGTPDTEIGWEPIFGSPVSRGLIQWAKSFGFSSETVGAILVLFLFGLHANMVPVCAWVLMELVKDPALWQAVKEEVLRAEATIDQDGHLEAGFDYKKLASLPLLTSIYTEVLRLRVGVLITRTAHEPVIVGGYTLPKGSIFQAPTEVAHLDEEVFMCISPFLFTICFICNALTDWRNPELGFILHALRNKYLTHKYMNVSGGTPEHPATEFWAYRHIKEKAVREEKGKVTN